MLVCQHYIGFTHPTKNRRNSGKMKATKKAPTVVPAMLMRPSAVK